MFKLSISSLYLIHISVVQVLSRERVLTLFSSRAKTGPLARFEERFKLMEKKRRRKKGIYIYTLYIYFDTLRLCRIKSVGRYAHSESIHAVTWNVMNPSIR